MRSVGDRRDDAGHIRCAGREGQSAEIDLRRAGRLLPEDVDSYRDRLRDYWGHAAPATAEDAGALDLLGLAADIDVPRDLQALLEHLQGRLQTVKAPAHVDARLLDASTRDLFTRIERQRKQMRARLPERDGLVRREGFSSRTITVTGLDFRFRVARRLLLDLHGGLFQ